MYVISLLRKVYYGGARLERNKVGLSAFLPKRGEAVKISARQAAALIRKQSGFKKAKGIRLLSCNTGSDSEGFAQHLANALGKPVMAPTKYVWALPNGKMWVADQHNVEKGTFVVYKPGGIKHG